MNTETQQAKLLAATLTSTHTLTRVTPWLLVGAIALTLYQRPLPTFALGIFLLLQTLGLLQLWLGWRLDLDKRLFTELANDLSAAPSLDYLLGLIKAKPAVERSFTSRVEGTIGLLRRWLGVTLLFWGGYLGWMGWCLV